MAGAIGFENIASVDGGVVVIAYFSALCDLRDTAARRCADLRERERDRRFATGTTAGALIEGMGAWSTSTLLTTLLAVPGIVLFWWMSRSGLVDAAMGTAGEADGQVAGTSSSSVASRDSPCFSAVQSGASLFRLSTSPAR